MLIHFSSKFSCCCAIVPSIAVCLRRHKSVLKQKIVPLGEKFNLAHQAIMVTWDSPRNLMMAAVV